MDVRIKDSRLYIFLFIFLFSFYLLFNFFILDLRLEVSMTSHVFVTNLLQICHMFAVTVTQSYVT